jgi:hypothetical protein
MYRVDTVITGDTGGDQYTAIYFDDGTSEGPSGQRAADKTRAFWSAVSGIISDGITLTVQPTVTVLSPVTGQISGVEIAEGLVPVTSPGVNEPAAPAGSQGLIRALTGVYLAGRQVVGKVYVPHLRATALGNTGVMTGASITTMETAAVANLGADPDAPGGDMTYVVWVRPSINPFRPPQAIPAEVFAGSTNAARLRSRQR